jgi:hypothetical protein
MVNKLDIKEELKAIDQRDTSWWDSLTEEEQSKVSIFVLMRYTSSVDNKNTEIVSHYLTMTNEFVNVHYNELRKDPQLQHKLLQLVGIGINQFHPWIAPSKKRKTNNKIIKWLSTLYPQYSDDELDLLVQTNDKKDLLDLAESSGLSQKEITELFK